MTPDEKVRPVSQPLSALERASAADRRWFEAHPGATERLRPALVGEFDVGGVVGVFPGGAWVRVLQLAPGVRVRELLP